MPPLITYEEALALGEIEDHDEILALVDRALAVLRMSNALAWTEAVTRVADTHVPDEDYEHARKFFGEKELVDLTFAIVTINGWNRLAVSFRSVPGSYVPRERGDAKEERE